jgi:predicted peptidase
MSHRLGAWLGLTILAFTACAVGIGLILMERRPAAQVTTGFVDCVYTDANREHHKYVVYVPTNYNGIDRLPLIIWLHGSHEKGSDGRMQLKVGLAQAIYRTLAIPEARPFSFLAFFPQSQSGGWDAKSRDGEILMAELADVEERFRVDANRLYLTGHSSGGSGTWELAAAYPDRWAAIVPVCGSGDPRIAPRIAKIPCWCFQGGADFGTSPQASRDMIQAIKAAGGDPKYTEFDALFHNIWRKVYVMPELYEWLDEQHRVPTN